MKKIIIAVGALVVVAVLAVVFLIGNINPIVEKGVEGGGTAIVGSPVSLGSANISFWGGSGELNDLQVSNPDGYSESYAFKADTLKVALDVKSITTDKVHIKEVILDAPEIVFEGGLKENNFSKLKSNAQSFAKENGPKEGEDGGKQGSKGPEKKVQIDYLRIENAKVIAKLKGIIEKDLTIDLPTLEMRDIGKEKEKTSAEAIQDILDKINGATIPAVQNNLEKLGKETVEKFGEDLKNKGEDLKKDLEKNLKNPFGDKDPLKGLKENKPKNPFEDVKKDMEKKDPKKELDKFKSIFD